MAESEHAELIKKLQEHGQSFMSGFSLPESAKPRQHVLPTEQDESDEEEWGGIGSDGEEGTSGTRRDGSCESDANPW
jgi:hypothetical protein